MERLPDRDFGGPGATSVFFLVRQPFIWVPTLLGAALSFGGMLWLSVENGKASVESVAMLALLAPLLGFGLAALTGLPAFMLHRALRAPKKHFDPQEGEALLEEARANHFLGGEGRGGRLYITDRRLVFHPHRFNVQLDSVELPLGAIRALGWRRVMRGDMPISTLVEVQTDAGTELFVIGDAERLAERIDEARLLAS